MQNRPTCRAFGLLLILGVAVGCRESADESQTHSTSTTGEPQSTETSTKANPQSAGYFQTPFQDESQFIVETIVSDLVEQIYYARHHQLPDAKHFSVRAVERPDSQFGAPTYDLEMTHSADRPSLKIRLVINGPIWSPDVYADTVAALAQEVGLTPTKQNERDTARLLAALVDG